MRLRNVKGADEIIKNSSYIILNPFDYIGKFSKIFSNSNPIHIEIGMGKGDFIIENALKYPNINFIGIEKYDSVIVRAIEKLENKDIPNLKLIREDALFIDKIFKKEIECLYLNFSDKYDLIFKKNKKIIMKTDNRHLFEYSIKSFTDYGYKINDLKLNLYEEDTKFNIQTEYEKKFVSKGLIIYYCEVEK